MIILDSEHKKCRNVLYIIFLGLLWQACCNAYSSTIKFLEGLASHFTTAGIDGEAHDDQTTMYTT